MTMSDPKIEKMPLPTDASPNAQLKHQASRSLRFFDLPTELRQRIYEYVSAAWPDQKIDLIEHSMNTIVEETLPALLRAGKRLSLDAGAYFFIDKKFDISMRDSDISTFAVWLARIGKVNRTRLLSSPNVKIRLKHEHSRCKSMCSRGSHPDANELTGSQFVKLINSFQLYRCDDAPVAFALAKWSFTCRCTGDVNGSVRWPHVDSIIDHGNLTKVTPREVNIEHQAVVLLKSLLDSIFKAHGHRKASATVDGKRRRAGC